MAFRKKALIFAGLNAFLAIWQVVARVDVIMLNSVEVKTGDRAEIPCRCDFSELPSEVTIQWFLVKKNTGTRQLIYESGASAEIWDDGTDFEGRINVTQSVNSAGIIEHVLLTVDDVRLSDEGAYICQVDAVSAGINEGTTQLKVFVPPESIIIQGVDSLISVTSEDPSKIADCETRNSYPKPNITWYRDLSPLHNMDGLVSIRNREIQESSGLFTVQSELYLKVVKEDKDSFFYCEVNYFAPNGAVNMKESERINITVNYPPTTVTLTQAFPDGLVKEGDTVEIRCESDGYPPPSFSFMRENVEEELPSNKGLLVLSGVTRADSGKYACVSLDLASFQEATGDIELQVHHLDHAVVYPKETVVEQGEDTEVSCNAQSSLSTHTMWFKDDSWISDGHVLVLQNVTFNNSGEYTCEVTVPTLPGLQVNGSALIIVQGAPEIKDPEAIIVQESMKKSINLSCEAWGYPRPVITWSNTGGQKWREVHTETLNGAQSVVTFIVTSDLSAACNATNDIGTDTKLFNIKAIPLTTSGSKVAISPLPKQIKKENSGVIIAVIIICILLLAILGSVLYFLYKKGKLPCGRSGKQEISKEQSSKDDIIMEMKSEKSEEAVLLQGVNGDKKPLNDQ